MQYPERKQFSLRFIAVLTLIAFCITSASADPGQPERIIIGFQEGSVQTLDDADLSSLDIQVIDELTGLDAVVVSVSDPDRFMEEVSQCPGVKFVERDIPVYALMCRPMCPTIAGMPSSGGLGGSGRIMPGASSGGRAALSSPSLIPGSTIPIRIWATTSPGDTTGSTTMTTRWTTTATERTVQASPLR
ncbi:exported protein of unknown function [Methanoculleus bourgensis]|uniref:Uncharacterized protein n=1 Tax=Methanoculleus bourgensis TaxID=83986 RepID=A0A0X3BQE3_9EURY|nr:exported protein of unknown function [Methanoculleus bourgensis]